MNLGVFIRSLKSKTILFEDIGPIKIMRGRTVMNMNKHRVIIILWNKRRKLVGERGQENEWVTKLMNQSLWLELPERRRMVPHHSLQSLQDWEGGTLGGRYSALLNISIVFTY